ncbi:stalk domain-containing protein [Cohnella candidum]|uniref:Copper amine oxidase-like N-terminal domain-containing protein n=1 Tax=Cohnella candidum TaxID=2674991 RepID=A0A3G3K224_9BACL|nr:stalk domain-containing protein [Cohnella candidum]AYQ74097.1 hypothetical protein EAV92_16930 [Cohnella candidum]
MKNKIVAFALILSLLFAFALPAQAEQAATLDIKLKIGSKQMTVNGTASTITAPYLTGKTPMVPLAVITKALGAKLALKGAKTMTLTYLKHTVVATIDSKSATFDGKKITLPAAPVSKNNVTMVPTQVIEGLGAKVVYASSTKEIRITVAAAPAGSNPGAGSVIDSDAGKSKIGDSYYSWSMNYPTGLVQDYQSDNGDTLIFRDIKKEYYLGIFVTAAKDPMSPEDKRTELYKHLEGDETVVDKQSLPGPVWPYEKITTKMKDGFYYEFRGLQYNGYFYAVIYGKKASSIAELRKETGILDSFKPIFDSTDKSLKNLAKVIGQTKTLTNKEYGFSVSLPKEWSMDADSTTPYATTEDEDAYLWMDVTSLVAGDTVDAWVDRRNAKFEQTFITEYRKPTEKSDVVWNGIPAKMLKMSYSFDTQTWWEEYEIFAIQGNYRYYTEFAYPVNKKDANFPLLQSILNTMKVDFKVIENNFGNIPDENDIRDLTQTSVKTSTKYKYSVTVPKNWLLLNADMEQQVTGFRFSGGSFAVFAYDVPDPQSTMEAARQSILDKYSGKDKIKIVEDTRVTFAGKPAIKLVLEDTTNMDKSPNRETSYMFENNGTVYVVEGLYYLANGTDFIKKQLETAMNSFTLNG